MNHEEKDRTGKGRGKEKTEKGSKGREVKCRESGRIYRENTGKEVKKENFSERHKIK